MSTKRGKAIFGIGLFLFGLAVFLLASSYLVARDQPKWLAAAVGALGFPVLPVLWHVLGERRRRIRIAAEKTPPKTTLAPGDRYLLRAVVVGAAVLVPMFVVGKFAVVRAAWDYKLWFLPDNYDRIDGADALLLHVPADADAVLVIRERDGDNKFGVVAYGDHQLAAIVPRDAKYGETQAEQIEQFNAQRSKVPFVKIDAVDAVSLGTRWFALATDRWQSTIRAEGSGPRAAITQELANAPASATIALAYVPAAPTGGIQKLSGWMIQNATNEKLAIEGKLEAVDAPSAERLLETTRALWKLQQSEWPETCRDEIGKLADKAEIERKGATITLHLTIEPEMLMGVMMCGLKSAKLGDE